MNLFFGGFFSQLTSRTDIIQVQIICCVDEKNLKLQGFIYEMFIKAETEAKQRNSNKTGLYTRR